MYYCHACISPRKKSNKYPSTKPMIPIVRPIFIISFCFTKPVEWAIAFGGVEIGRVIATDAATAIPISTVGVLCYIECLNFIFYRIVGTAK